MKYERIESVWQVCREYAGIAEAGGVKNVVCSLSEGLVQEGIAVSVFIPLYGFIDTVRFFLPNTEPIVRAQVEVGDTILPIAYYEIFIHNVRILFVDAPIFIEKKGVYTYTEGELRGKGHHDAVEMNIVLQKAVIAFSLSTGEIPSVLHCQDAHTALLPALINSNAQLKNSFCNTHFVVSIHNAGLGYHQEICSLKKASDMTGIACAELEKSLVHDAVEPFLAAAPYASVTTVSPWYAEELLDPSNPYSGGLSVEFAKRSVSIKGITNGIDFDRYNPQDCAKSLLPAPFNPSLGNFAGKRACTGYLLKALQKKALPKEIQQFGYIAEFGKAVYFSYHGRIAVQKGLDILAEVAEILLERMSESRFIIIGQGDPELEAQHIQLAERFEGRYVFLRGYERSLARLCVAAADFLVLPSRFEPCGLEDFIAQIFATIPVAHAVGGLQKIIHGETGFLYTAEKDSQADEIHILSNLLYEIGEKKLHNARELIDIQKNASIYVENTYSWKSVIQTQYIPLYLDTGK